MKYAQTRAKVSDGAGKLPVVISVVLVVVAVVVWRPGGGVG